MLWFLLLLGCKDHLEPEVDGLPRRAPAAWNRLLGEIVDDRGDVDYAHLRANRRALDEYVAWIGRDDAMRGKTGQQPHAFWINAFNALVLYQVLERDIEVSVNEVPSLLPWEGSRFWWGTELVVAGQPMSLWEIGHERVTHLNQDYRDFAVLSVAARSGPPLRGELYTAEQLEVQLDGQFARFVSTDRGLRFDPDGTVRFNPVFERYADELSLYMFALDPCSLAALHTEGRRQERLLDLAERGCPHESFPFDWSLNRAGEGR